MSEKTSLNLENEAGIRKQDQKHHRQFGFILIVAGIVIIVGAIFSMQSDDRHLIAPKGTIKIELAKTEIERESGLMNRRKMDKDAGMLFVFDEGDANCFWMKNTYIPLDMIWLDANKKVVFVHRNATPLSEVSLCPDKTATFVLEVNAGQADVLGLSLGAQVQF